MVSGIILSKSQPVPEGLFVFQNALIWKIECITKYRGLLIRVLVGTPHKSVPNPLRNLKITKNLRKIFRLKSWDKMKRVEARLNSCHKGIEVRLI